MMGHLVVHKIQADTIMPYLKACSSFSCAANTVLKKNAENFAGLVLRFFLLTVCIERRLIFLVWRAWWIWNGQFWSRMEGHSQDVCCEKAIAKGVGWLAQRFKNWTVVTQSVQHLFFCWKSRFWEYTPNATPPVFQGKARGFMFAISPLLCQRWARGLPHRMVPKRSARSWILLETQQISQTTNMIMGCHGSVWVGTS